LVAIIDNQDPATARPVGPIDEFYTDPHAGIAVRPGAPVPVAELTQVPPVPRTARIFCIGLNYPLHIQETSKDRPAHPNIFGRWASKLSVDGASVPVPPGETGLDCEAELAVVIGSEMSAVTDEEAMAGVFGYTGFNDISARTYQNATSQFTLGKNADHSAPIGPVIVTADELGDPYSLRIRSRLNGETMQDSVTANMIFNIAETISYISGVLTLRPGDVIATGTPDGVGAWREPPVLMVAGDVIEVEIERIGILTSTIS
ncbi:MAG: fumarylacetoacetate hydrolase family protein, partial [Acidimicrobiales bacterium]